MQQIAPNYINIVHFGLKRVVTTLSASTWLKGVHAYIVPITLTYLAWDLTTLSSLLYPMRL